MSSRPLPTPEPPADLGRPDALQYEDLPPRRLPARRPRRPWRWVLIVVGVLVLLLAVAALWFQRQVSGHPHGPVVAVTIPQGTSTIGIGNILHKEGVIGNTTVWRVYTMLKRPGALQSGDFRFQHDENMGKVLSTLEGGAETTVHRLTIPEGSTLKQIAAKVGNIPGLNAERFLAIAQSGTVHSKFQPPGSTSLEGLLFPDTYFVEKKDDEASILNRMVQTFDDMATTAGVQDAPAKVGLSPYQAIIIASLIEREAKLDEERPMMSRVMYNRLQKNMKLGIDATVEYAIGTHKPSLTNQDLDVDSPYNTRKFPGLPPTPIAASGRASLAGAVSPTPGPWLFYVLADRNGRHAFTDNDADFQRLVRESRAKGLL